MIHSKTCYLNLLWKKKFKQGLPIVDFRKDKIVINLIKEAINQNDFKTNNIWDGQKIIADFNNINIRSKKINKISNLIRAYLMNKGFEKRKEKVIKANKKCEENFNKLN